MIIHLKKGIMNLMHPKKERGALMGQALTELYENLKQQGTNSIISRGNAIIDPMLDNLRQFFNIESLHLSESQISELDGSNNFSITGITSLLNFKNIKTKITFFTSNLMAEPDNTKIECIIEFIDSIPTWNLSKDFPDIPEYFKSYSESVGEFKPSFLKEINFATPKLFFSTLDFLDKEINQIVTSLEESITCGNKLLKKGINFAAGIVATAGTFWDTVKEVVKGLDVLDVVAQITCDAYGELVLLVEQELEDIDFKITEDVAFKLKKMYLKGGLNAESIIKPVVIINAQLIYDGKALPFTLEIDIGRNCLIITSESETGQMVGLDEVLAIAGIKDLSLANYLPEGSSIEYFGYGLLKMRFEIALSPFYINSLGFSFATVNPWGILDQRISIQPTLDWKIQNPFDEALRKIDLNISGKWNLGSTLMDIFALPDTGEIYAKMLPGDMVDINTLIQSFSLGINIPEIPFSELCLSANYLKKSFYLSVESAGTWSFDLGFGKLEIFDAWLLIDYSEGDFQEFCIGGFLELAGVQIEVEAKYSQSEGWILEGGIAIEEGTSIGTLTNNIIDGFEGFSGVSIPINIPESFNPLDAGSLYVKYKSKTNELSIFVDLDYSFSIGDNFSSDEAVLNLEFDSDGLKNAYIRVNCCVCDIDLELTTKKVEDVGWMFSGALAEGEEISINKVVDKLLKIGGISLPDSTPDFVLENIKFDVDFENKNFFIHAESQTIWEIPLGITELKIGDITGEFKYQDGKSSGMIKGTAEIAGVKAEISYDMSQGLVIYATIPDISTRPLTDALCGADVFDLVPLPGNIGSLDITDISIMINIKKQDILLKGTIENFGDAIFFIKKIESKWGFCVAVILKTGFEFSSISSFLSFLDTVELYDLSMIMSSYNGDLSIPGLPELTGPIINGLNFMMKIDMNKVAELMFINKLVKMENNYLPLYCYVFKDGGAQIDANLVSDVTIGCGLTLKRTALRMRFGQGVVSYSMLASILLDIGDQLLFTGEATVYPNGASFSATMEGTWSDPFGIKGINISDVAATIGFTTCPIPTIGVAGSVDIRGVTGEIGVLLNTINPQQSALHLKFNQLGIRTIFDICDPSILQGLPDYFAPIVETGLRDVEVYIVPQTTFIGQIRYEEGFRAKGTMNLLGLEAHAEVDIDQQKGLTASGYLSPINLLNILKITGANGEPNANFSIDMRTGKTPKAHISGCIDFLDLQKYSIYADLSEEGFVFALREKLYGLVELGLDTIIKQDAFYAGGSISFGIGTLGPIKVGGVTLIDAIPINTGFEAATDINVSLDGFALNLTGSIEILGVKLVNIGIHLDKSPKDFKELYDFVVDKLVDELKENFMNIFANIGVWAKAVVEGLIEFGGDIAQVSKEIFNATMESAVNAYKIIGKGVNEAVEGLKNVYGVGAETVAALLERAQYAVDEIIGALKNVYQLADSAVADIIKGLGYGIEEIGKAISAACDLAAEEVAKALDTAGYALNEIAGAMKDVYSLAESAVASLIKNLGYGVEEVSKAISEAFKIGAEALAMALKNVGYAAEQVMKGINAALNAASDVAALALKYAGYAVEQIAGGLKQVYGAAEKAVTETLKAVGFIAGQVAQALSVTFGIVIEDAALLLKGAGYAVEQIAEGLKSAYNVAVNAVANVLENAGYLAQDVAQAIKAAYSVTIEMAASVLKAAGYGVAQVAGALNSAYQAAAEGVTMALKAVGYAAGEIMDGIKSAYGLAAQGAASVLNACGYAAGEIANALKNAYGLAAQGTAQILKGLRIASGLVADGLKNIYGLASDGVAQIMKAIGCTANEIADAMKNAFNIAGEGAVVILKGLGYGLNEVGNAVSQIYNIGADGIASALKNAGYAVGEVGDFLRNTLGYSCEAVQGILSGVGYAADAVGDFLKDAFDWVPHVDFPYIDFPHVDLPHWDGW